jgi:hypothetical protein
VAEVNKELNLRVFKLIDNIELVGNLMLFCSLLVGVYFFFLSRVCIKSCGYSNAVYEIEPMMIVWGVGLMIGGWVQLQFNRGFAEIIRQLFVIRTHMDNKMN